MGWFGQLLVTLPGWTVLGLVFLVPALEASSFPGVVLPGQSTVLIGGALAHLGRAPLVSVVAAAALGGVLGWGVGYAVGRRWGPGAARRLPRRLVRPADLDRACRMVRGLGGPSLVAVRFVGVLRTLAPAASGAAGVDRRRFLAWNTIGGVVWAVSCSLAGFGLGDSWARLRSVASVTGWGTAAIFGLLPAAAVAGHLVRSRAGCRAGRRTRSRAGSHR
jgi:membrane-associated protein